MSMFTDNIDYVSTGFLNTVNDPVIGGLLSSGTGASPRAGQLGKKVHMTQDEAYARYYNKTLSGTTVPQLYSGIYQYVQFKAGSSSSNVQGQVVFWDTAANSGEENYVVTPDAPSVPSPIAGITLNPSTWANSKGNYGWIQIAGLATVKFCAAVTKGTPVAGDLVVLDLTPTNTADVLADATNITSVQARVIIGKAYDAPVSAALKRVLLAVPTFNC